MYVDLAKMHQTEHGSLLVRLMMAANDICTANQCLSQFEKNYCGSCIGAHVLKGAKMYFLRLEWGHLNEAMKLIREFKDTQELADFLETQCTLEAQEAFSRLANCVKDGCDHRFFTKTVAILRSKTAFHYDKTMVSDALSDRVSREKTKRSKITLGTEGDLWRYHVADDIVDSIVCRQIWQIPRNANLVEEANKISLYAQHLAKDYQVFCSSFVVNFLEKHRAIS